MSPKVILQNDLLLLETADTEYAWKVPVGIVAFYVKARVTANTFRMSFSRGTVATGDNYLQMDAGAAFNRDNILPLGNEWIFFASLTAGAVIEIAYEVLG